MKGLKVMIIDIIDNSISSNNLQGGSDLPGRKPWAAFLCLIATALLLTACNGNGGASGHFDDGSGATYAGPSTSNASSSSSSGGSSTVTITFEDLMKYSNSGDVDELVRRFSAASGGSESGEAGVDVVALSASDLGLPAGGTVTLSITGGVEDYEETVTADSDGMVYFLVPRQAVGSEITVGLVVKKADGTLVCSGKKTQLVKAGSQFSIALSSSGWQVPEDFVLVGSLYMCSHEVTQGEYEKYCSYGGPSPSAGGGCGNSFPAYYVSFYDALVYCNKRSIAEGLTPCYSIGGSTNPVNWTGIGTGSNGKPCGPGSNLSNWNNVTVDTSANGYRLPTVAEWVQAASDGHTYSGSNTVGEVAWYDVNSEGKAHEVKGLAPNSAGIYDMSGNVWELCWDIVSSPNRAIRGGSWYHPDDKCKISTSGYRAPNQRASDLGFRVVCKGD